MSYMRLTLRELPAIDPPIVSVSVDYPGASAAVVETRITQALEDALAGIEGINTIDSRSRSEEHTSELQSLMRISYAVFCLKKKKKRRALKIEQCKRMN